MAYTITCPYCFEQFDDTSVHFRMQTIREPEYSEEELMRRRESEERNRLLGEYYRDRVFQSQEDPIYTNFWNKYGGTTEVSTNAERQMYGCEVYELPIVNPADPTHQAVLKIQKTGGIFILDGDGMVVGIEDMFGKVTKRRVCPHCHNPLPLGYGKNTTKFISVIGVTGAGKTVYISQLLKFMVKYAAYAKLAAFVQDDHVNNFIMDNAVEQGQPMPDATIASRLAQPLSYDLVRRTGEGKSHTDTIVIYDIAGENCQNAQQLQAYGDFVTKSDGILLLLDPSQLGFGNDMSSLNADARAAIPESVLNAIYQAFAGGNSSEQCRIPLAVCVSKSDTYETLLPSVGRKDITPSKNKISYNATEYNELEEKLADLMSNSPQVSTLLEAKFSCFNYFAFSATGCAVKKNAEGQYCPVAPPIPRRIAEPMLWMFQKFGFIAADTPIRLPVKRYPSKDPKTGRPGVPIKRTFGDKLFGKQRYRNLTPAEIEALDFEPGIWERR